MCLAIPGKIVELDDEGCMRMGRIDYGGIRRNACLEYIADPKIGEYVMVHVGLAISKEIVERSGGAIGHEPNPDGGSIFWFTLPAA